MEANNISILAKTYINLMQNLEEQIEEQAAMFAALADPTRLKLVKLLCRQRIPDALCVNALAAILGITQSAVSQHLRVLRGTGLVKGERRGYHIHYFVNLEALERYRNLVLAALTTEEPLKKEPIESYCPIRRENHVSSK
jgi:ArsR family transcriptional regulator